MWTLTLSVVTALMAAWGVWFAVSLLGVHAVSDTARLEVAGTIRSVEAPVSGRIVAVLATVGEEVQASDVLVELDTQAERLRLEEERAGLRASLAQRRALDEELHSKTKAFEETSRASRAALQEAEGRRAESEAAAWFAEEQLGRLARLHQDGLVADLSLHGARAECEQRRAAAEARRIAVVRLRSELAAKAAGLRAELAELEREARRLEGEIEHARASIARLEHEPERRLVRAPVAGRIAELASLGPGAWVEEGERLGSVVPAGEVKVVAEFAPPDALGRIRPGQEGRMRLEGFSWTHYGSLPVTVSRVASEPRSGRVRVELAPRPEADSPIPLQHGLPGTVEIDVERVTPATLVLRAVGRRLTRPPVLDESLETE